MPAELLTDSALSPVDTDDAVAPLPKGKAKESKKKRQSTNGTTSEVAQSTIDPDRENRSFSSPGNELLRVLCEDNGISEDVVMNNPQSVQKLEMFMFTFPRMRCLHFFPNLRQLVIIQQSIEVRTYAVRLIPSDRESEPWTLQELEEIDDLVNLESLWVAECRLTEIRRIESCTSLTKLYLYSNKIQKVENLQTLTKLEVHPPDQRPLPPPFPPSLPAPYTVDASHVALGRTRVRAFTFTRARTFLTIRRPSAANSLDGLVLPHRLYCVRYSGSMITHCRRRPGSRASCV